MKILDLNVVARISCQKSSFPCRFLPHQIRRGWSVRRVLSGDKVRIEDTCKLSWFLAIILAFGGTDC